ncbi:type II toxin-antitoxin system RelE/ParE family toxin [Marinomonas epiphytica]
MIYKTKVFASLTKKEALSDNDLVNACKEMSNGLFDADLGGNVYKKRIASGNKGKSGGFRTIVGAVIGDKYFFLYAFAKSDRANINSKEKLALKELAKEFLEFSQDELNQLIEDGELIKVGEL